MFTKAKNILNGNGGTITLENNLQISFYKTAYYDKKQRKSNSSGGRILTDLGIAAGGKLAGKMGAYLLGSFLDSVGAFLLYTDIVNHFYSKHVDSILDDEGNIGVAIVEGTSLFGCDVSSTDLAFRWQEGSYLAFLSEYYGEIKSVEFFE